MRRTGVCLATAVFLVLLFVFHLGEIENTGGKLAGSFPERAATIRNQSVLSLKEQRGVPYSADFFEIEEYLKKQVPELEKYAAWIQEQSQGKADIVINVMFYKEQISKGESNDGYYFVYVGEQWQDHRVNWDWFCVNENMNEILWYDLADGEGYLALDAWRASDGYRDWI